MSDVPHIPWAYSLDDAPQLPLTGDQNPLRRELARWLLWASGITLAVLLAVFLGYQWWSQRKPVEAPVVRQVKIMRYTDLGVPPSIAKPTVPQINVAQEVAKIAAPPPKIAVPEPVPDEQAAAPTIATQTEMSEALEPITVQDLGTGNGTGDSLVVDQDIDTSPAPFDFVAVEQEPALVSIAQPVYPDVAKKAGIEGTVTMRVLVGKDGKVKNAMYIDGPEALKDAADTCARTAVFRPALQDHKPVEVWVMVPVTFKLRG
jgi:TonB family protein